jgi:guanosine-3',5'-bis(diphosphate) 3'-pyrophosphohydrolase
MTEEVQATHDAQDTQAAPISDSGLPASVPLDTAVELPQEKLIRRLCAMLAEYLSASQIADVHRAYKLAAASHEGQFRVSGEAYICHPVSVAIILAGMRMDARGIIAGLLHDVIEDSAVTKAQLAEQFSEEVANLVDGVSKLTQLDSKSRAEAQAQNLRKMVMAMVKDLRVIMVKLADRLHNMRTLGVMVPERRRRIARETLDIYAPIANRLGMNEVRLELEDLGFSALYPFRHRVLEHAVNKARGSRKEVVGTVEAVISKRLVDAGLADSQVIGREKHLYSIYQKMRSKRRSFAEVFDVYAFRIVMNEVDQCYRSLGVAHSIFKPIPGRFKDYIAVPKANGYQSLHTTLVGPDGLPLEIQIRTRSMHQIAESGVAAHWAYKSDDTRAAAPITRADEWLRDLVEIQKDAGDSLEFLENLKVDLFQQEVYVLTPKGKIIKLPRGATIVDFAYAVHTDIGNACVSARLDRVLAPLQTILQNGQTVEIITAPWAKPNPLWLNFVVTAKARASIRAYLRHFQQQEAISLGQRLLEKELSEHNQRFEDVTPKRMKALLAALDAPSMDQLLEDLGLGNRLPFLVARLLLNDNALPKGENEPEPGEDEPVRHAPLIIKGTEGMVVSLARCCRPIPGDPIVGFFNPGKGIVIHLNECKNVHDLRKKQLNWLDVEWDREVSGEFSVEVRLELLNQVGTLATVAGVLSHMQANIENVQINNQDTRVSTDIITLQVKDRVHLANVMRELRKLSVVLKISRNKAELRKHK